MALLKESKKIPYLMGRLYAVLEDTEKDVDRNPYAKYYRLAQTSPVLTFGKMMELFRSRKLHASEEKSMIYERAQEQLDEIIDKMDFEEFLTYESNRFTLEECGQWVLGYHHQRGYMEQ